MFQARYLFALPLLVLLAGCVVDEYEGKKFAPTDRVEVYYDERDVPSGYRVIGTDRAEASEFNTSHQMVHELKKKAKSVGADAMVVSGVSLVPVGSYTERNDHYTRGKPAYVDEWGDIHYKHSKWEESSQTTVQRDKVITAKFLKRE